MATSLSCRERDIRWLRVDRAYSRLTSTSPSVSRENLGAYFLLQNFPDLRSRQVRPDVHLLRRLDAADTPFDEMNELFDVQRAAWTTAATLSPHFASGRPKTALSIARLVISKITAAPV
jgi:hypothetical protein